MNAEDTIVVTDVVIEKMKVGRTIQIGAASLRDMRMTSRMEQETETMILNLQTYLLTQKIAEDKYVVEDTKTVHIPSTWWDHFKKDVMPKWFTNKFPVNYNFEIVKFHKTIKLERLETYPKSSLAMQGNRDFVKLMGPPVLYDRVEIE